MAKYLHYRRDTHKHRVYNPAMQRAIQYIIIHTAADIRSGGCHDTSAEEIRAWHKARGFSNIGYHFVVRRTGKIETGRPISQAGAHALGVNRKSIGICLSGHGDLCPPTEEQWQALIQLVTELATQFKIPRENILGHREINTLVDKGILSKQYRTTKTCPGKSIPMNALRHAIGTD